MKNQKNVSRIERIEKIWTPDAKLWTPYEQGQISFAFPSLGPNAYRNVGKEVLSHGLRVPTGDYTASLVHSAYCDTQVKDEPEFQNIREIMKNRWLWVFNNCLWTDKGVYVIQDLKAEGKDRKLNLKSLEKSVNAKGIKDVNGVRFSKDGRVRFAPKETYQLGEKTSQSLSEDGFVIASYDVDGAKRLGEVSGKFQSNPFTYGVVVSEGAQPELRISALGGIGGRLLVVGYSFGGWGLAFGVF